MTHIKRCSRCGDEKPITQFNRNCNSKDGYASLCKLCQKYYRDSNIEKKRETDRKWRENNRDRIKQTCKEYNESHRDEILKQRLEYREKRREWLAYLQRIYNKGNRDARLKYSREYRIKNASKVSEGKRDWYNRNKQHVLNKTSQYSKTPKGRAIAAICRHRRRAIEKSVENSLTFVQWLKIIESQNNRCAKCGKRFSKKTPPTRDHIIPVSKGGGLTFENVQALCVSCNCSKQDTIDHSLIISWVGVMRQ